MSAHKVLTLKYRPQNLDELWVQEHIKITLKQAILNNQLANAYLFAGPRGVGKTTTARILAKSINCINGPTIYPCQVCSNCIEITNTQSLDVLEIDGASNRGIDQVRELRENIKFLPAKAHYKIYIIDEVHMLTQEAFNALLKTLEEPPQHVKFIFATTAPQRVPSTILSRCQRFDFRKATEKEIAERLKWISKQEDITISDEALLAISKRADGAIRDAEGMLDQLRVFCDNNITLKDVEELFGLISSDVFFEYTELVIKNDPQKIINFIEEIFSLTYDFIEFYNGLLEHFRTMLHVKLDVLSPTFGITEQQLLKFKKQAEKFSIFTILQILQFLLNYESMIKYTSEPQILFEVISLSLMEVVKIRSETSNQNISENEDFSKVLNSVILAVCNVQSALSFHLRDAQIKRVTNNEIQIICATELGKKLIEEEHPTIEKLFSEALGQKVTVHILTAKDSSVPKRSSAETLDKPTSKK
ncbi:MAG: DNA polymerase III subunit gamma/tau [candidate division WOR-3 bacterium]|nr:DNA polymerase III subunit gamma/tau [candidate division WOR-3 bacterium]MCX7756904.1 DNA polymerase III subunit gamma/tau [candidate division WOR-3 bacterium]MDW7987853.1 DNA polymerase III subunit gamma/tau [candidate division WOR-3 bacterium]